MPYQEDFHQTPEQALGYQRIYNRIVNLHFKHYPEADIAFKKATLVCDLGSGTGASMIFAGGLCPQAQIVTVDCTKKPFPELTEQLDERHIKHVVDYAGRFLKAYDYQQFDVVFIVKAPDLLIGKDCAQLARCTSSRGFILELQDDEKLPVEMHNYFDSVSSFESVVMGKTYTDVLWRKRE